MQPRLDNPIRRVEQDDLGRAAAATSFARRIRSLEAADGVVVSVLGPWGSGKTSFVNLAREELASSGAQVLDFNPWMFSGSQQLVESFFAEVSAQLRLRGSTYNGLADALTDYGEAFSGLVWLPVVGPWIERVRGGGKFVSNVLQRRREGVEGRRQKLSKALEALQAPLIVVVDDVDRLTTSEIRDIFKLVRLTASFPNVVYLLAFDRARVETALTEDGVPGRDYLEKILQLGFDLPRIPDRVLSRQIAAALDDALDGAGVEELDHEAWADIFWEIVTPLVSTMRDVRRYALAVSGTAEAARGQVSVADLLALEAVRVFLPDVFAKIATSVDALTTPSPGLGGTGSDKGAEEALEDLLKTAGGYRAVAEAMIFRLFPFGARHIGGSNYDADFSGSFLKARRVAHKTVLSSYLEQVASPELLNFERTERVWKLLANADELDEFLRSLDPAEVADVLDGLRYYEGEYSSDQVVPASVVILNLAPDVPVGEHGALGLSNRDLMGIIAYWLLRSLADPDAAESALRRILSQVSSLSSRRALIMRAGYREGVGHGLIPREAAEEIEGEWQREVARASTSELAGEYDLLGILLQATKYAQEKPGGSTFEVPEDPRLTLAVLNAARSESQSQTVGNRAVRRTPRLAWDALTAVYGGEAELERRIAGLLDSDVAVPDELSALVERYRTGWRPHRFHDD